MGTAKHGVEICLFHLRSCLFGKVEKHKWNRSGDGQTEASETKGTRVKRYGFRICQLSIGIYIEY